LLVAGACGSDPPSTTTIRAKLGADLGNVLHNANDAANGSTSTLPTLTGFLPAAMPAMPAMSSFDPDAAIQWLDDHIFTDANNLGDGIYKVPPELFCTTTTVDSLGNTVSTVDPDCVNRVTTAQLRVRVEEDDATLRFSLQVDANHDEPLSFALVHTSLAITIDLDDASHAMIALAQALGGQAPNAAMSGAVTGKLEILGDAHARASLSIDRAVSVKFADAGVPLDGPDATRFASAAAQVLSIEGDANAPLFAVDLGLGETTVHTSTTDLDLGGATANLSYSGGSSLTIDHISLGTKTTTMAKNGVQGLAIDLNANDGRALSATVATDASGTETLTVTPKLDLQIATDHAALGDTPPVYDVVRVLLDGALSGTSGSGVVRVNSGSFAITTNPAAFGFAATAGQCVTSTTNTDPATYNNYTTYSVAACP
jgi:hypothetical protein